MVKQIKGAKYLYFSSLIVVFTLFILGTFLDLNISKAIVVKPNAFTIYFETFGWMVGYSFVPIATLVLFYNQLEEIRFNVGLKVVSLLLSIGGGSFIIKNGLKGLVKRGVANFSNTTLLSLLIASAITAILIFALKEFSKKHYRELIMLGICAIYFFAVYAIFVEGVFKPLVNRFRFDDMEGIYDNFTPWYVRGNGGSSFPSGHTAVTSAMLFICCIPDIFKNVKWKRYIFFAISLVYVSLMGLARIMIGRHYLTDVTFSMLLMGGALALLINSRYYNKMLNKFVKG
jgi:membrane-associated phospholipid phosphatase